MNERQTKAELTEERDEFRMRLASVFEWNRSALAKHSPFLSSELHSIVTGEEIEFGFQ